MRKLLNTLYITMKDAFLALDGENVVVKTNTKEIARFPLHTIENIITFSYIGASPALMGKCADKGIALSFCTPSGKFLARCNGKSRGNVLLRREQYRIADDPERCGQIVSTMLFGKIFNARWVLERAKRDHALRVDVDKLAKSSAHLYQSLLVLKESKDVNLLRGIEGDAAATYFDVFDQMILRDKDVFFFRGRSRRPPKDAVNALLSFVYTLLTGMCTNAAESVGLDSYVGFLHRDRPGRTSLSLDMMEELRPCMADRFVLTLINNRIVSPQDFIFTESGAVILSETARKTVLKAWQDKKQETIRHPFLKKSIQWGLVPFVQAQLLSRYIRNDLEAYPPFLWK